MCGARGQIGAGFVYPSPGPSPKHQGGELNLTHLEIRPENSQLTADLGETFPQLI